MNLVKKIKGLRLIAFFLFLFGSISIIGSLVLSNYLHTFPYDLPMDYKKINLEDNPDSDSNDFLVKCNEENHFCKDTIWNAGDSPFLKNAPKVNSLDLCYVYTVKSYLVIDGKKIDYNDAMQFIYKDKSKGILKSDYKDKKIIYISNVINEKDEGCIKNSSIYSLYKIFPYWHDLMVYFNSVRKSGVSGVVNPFVKGETSISNLVKRYPINLVFKTFLYISVILMILYWRVYNLLFQRILNKEKNNFYYFGIFSAICLFFHVLFLGMEIENEAFQNIRKIIILLFILNELLAQLFLARELRIHSKELLKYSFLNVIKLKVYFIYSLLVITSLFILALIIYDVPKYIIYILEWNYFIGLLFYYLLSSLMWKKLVS